MELVPPQLRLREAIDLPGSDPVAVGEGTGGQYLVVAVAGRSGPCWLCAPVSGRAVDCVRSGQASPWAVLQHSITGTIDVYRTLLDGSVRESVVLCSRLPGGRAALAAA